MNYYKKIEFYIKNLKFISFFNKLYKNKKLLNQNKITQIESTSHSLLQLSYEQLKNQNKKSILFVACLHFNGGIEERLYKITNLLKNKYNIFIISINSLNFYKLYQPYIYNYSMPSSLNKIEQELFLKKIISYHNIQFTCFEIGYIPDSDVNQLKINNNKIIAIFHESIDSNNNKINYNKTILDSDHVFAVTIPALSALPCKNKSLFLNGTLEIKNYYQQNNSNKILIACRLDYDNFHSFLKYLMIFLNKHNFSVDLAGINNAYNTNIEKKLLSLNPNINFIGFIDTINYLKSNPNKYLFIAGVGQFLMEGISLNFPALLATKYNKFTFINKQNFLEYYNKTNSATLIILEDENQVIKDITSIQNGNIDNFQLIDLAQKHMLFSNHVNNFIDTIENL
jgi:hypothetical protein